MPFKRRRSDAEEESQAMTDGGQSQLDFDAQPASYEASESISTEENYSSADQQISQNSEAEVQENAEQPVKVTVRRKKAVVRVEKNPESIENNASEVTDSEGHVSENRNVTRQNQRFQPKSNNRKMVHRSIEGRSDMPVPTNAIDPSVMQSAGDCTDENSKPRLVINELTAMGMHELRDLVRRQICLTLEEMNLRPEASHHETGPGQNEIDFRYSEGSFRTWRIDFCQRFIGNSS